MNFSYFSALDPAGPYFGLLHVKLHDGPISKEDATLVDVMHTNSGFILEVSFIYIFSYFAIFLYCKIPYFRANCHCLSHWDMLTFIQRRASNWMQVMVWSYYLHQIETFGHVFGCLQS